MALLTNIIVIPVHKATPTDDELLSLQQCALILKSHPICIVCPDGLDVSFYSDILSSTRTNWTIERFYPRFFEGIKGYNLLMLDKAFYKRFAEYQHMLIYQLDAWVFRDELDEWCSKGYDYIGAPWIEKDNKGNMTLACVGNGGFSLRRVQHFIDVLTYNGPVRKASQLDLPPSLKNNIYKLFYSLGYQNTIEYYRQSAFLHRSSPAFAVVYYSTTPRDPYTPSPIVNFFAVLTITVILVTWFILIRKTRSRTATGPQSLSVNDTEQQMPESEMSKKI